MAICLECTADLHRAQLMPLPLTVSCFSEIQIGFTFLVPAHPGSPGQGPLNGCVRVTSVPETKTETGEQSERTSWIDRVHLLGDDSQRLVGVVEALERVAATRAPPVGRTCSVLFCCSAVLDPRVGHTMDVPSPFIPVLCHSD